MHHRLSLVFSERDLVKGHPRIPGEDRSEAAGRRRQGLERDDRKRREQMPGDEGKLTAVRPYVDERSDPKMSQYALVLHTRCNPKPKRPPIDRRGETADELAQLSHDGPSAAHRECDLFPMRPLVASSAGVESSRAVERLQRENPGFSSYRGLPSSENCRLPLRSLRSKLAVEKGGS